MIGGINKILLVSIVCFCMTLAFPVEDNEKGKSTEAPLIASEHLAKGQEKEPKLDDQKHKDEVHLGSNSSSNEKQQQKEPPQKASLEGEHPKPEKLPTEQTQENKDQHPEKPSEQTTLSSAHDHQKPHDHNDQLAVPTEEKKEEQKDVELRHLPAENNPIGSFLTKESSLVAAKLEHDKKDEPHHQEKKIEEAILASTGASEKKPEEKALPEPASASEAKDEQKTTSEQSITESSSSKGEAAEGHSTAAPGASTTLPENQSEHENKPHHDHQENPDQQKHEKADLPSDSAKETTEASQQQTTAAAGLPEQTSTSGSVANTSNTPNL